MHVSLRPWIALALLAGCTPLPDDANPPAGPPDEELPPVGTLSLDILDNVVFEEELGSSWNCDGEEDPAFCKQDYLDLAGTLMEPGFDAEACRREVVDELVGLWAQIESEGAPRNVWTADDLAVGIIDATGLRELRELRQDPDDLIVRVISTDLHDGHTDSFLVIEDPLLGDVPARRLSPLTQGPNPGILVLPGHPSQPDATLEFADHQHGRLLARAGYDVLILSPRAYNGYAEHDATTEMLCVGLSMVAVRHLEALLLKRVLVQLQETGIVGDIALMGHSGGAIHANALARWDHSFSAFVTDHFWPYVDVGPCEGDDGATCIADTNVPRLLPYAESIESKEEPPWAIPHHVQEYGYPNPDDLIDFLRSTIGGR